MDGSSPVAWKPCQDCGAHVGSDRLVFGNPSGGRPQSFNRRAHEASGCRLWAALVGAQPYGVGGDGPTGLSSPEIAKLRDQQAQRQPSLGTFPAPEVGERKLEPAAQTPNRRANGNEGISRIVRRLGTRRPGIDDDIPVRGRVEVPKQRHNCVGGGTNLSNQVGFIGPSDAGQGVADVRRGLRHDVNSSLVGGIERDGIDIQPPCRRAAFQKPFGQEQLKLRR